MKQPRVTLPDTSEKSAVGRLSMAAIDCQMTADREAEIAAYLQNTVHRVKARLARMFSRVMSPAAPTAASR